MSDSTEARPVETVRCAEFMLFLVEQARRKTYGDVVLKLVNGQIVSVRLDQSFKPGQLPVTQGQVGALADTISGIEPRTDDRSGVPDGGRKR